MARKGARAADAATPGFEGDRLAALGRGLLVVKLVAVLVVFDPLAADAFALPKVAIGRATSFLLAAVLVALTLRHGRRIWRWSPIYAPAFAFLAWSAASSAFAVDRQVALFGVSTRLLGLATLAELVFVLVATAVLVRTRPHAELLLIAFVGASVPILMYFAVQTVGLDPIQWSLTRPLSTFGNPTHLGAYCSIVASVCIAVLVSSWTALPPVSRASLGALAVLNVVAMVPAGQRAPIVGFAGGLAVIFAMVRLRGQRAIAIFTVAAILAVGIFGFLVASSDIRGRFEQLLGAGDPERATIWSVSAQVVREHPLFGVGPDNLAVVYQARRPADSVTRMGPATLESSTHDLPLQIALSSGIPALAAMILLLAIAAREVVQLMRTERAVPAVVAAGSIAFLVNALFIPDDYGLEVPFWMGLGVIGGLTASNPNVVLASARGRASSRGYGHRSKVPSQVGVAVIMLLGVVAALSPWRSVDASHQALLSDGLSAAGRHAEALTVARSAVALDAGRPQYWSLLGREQLATGDGRSALAAFDRAALLAPYTSGYWINIASTYLALTSEPDRLRKAIDAGRRATTAQPVDPSAHAILARALIQAGERDAAIAEAQRAVDLWPATPDAYEVLAVGYGQKEMWTEAEKAIRAGLAREDSTRFHLLLARLLFVTGHAPDALAEIDLVLAREPANDEARALRSGLANASFNAQVAAKTPCTAVSVSPSIPSPQSAGTPVTFSATAAGCAVAEYRFYNALPETGWHLVRDWSSTPTFTFASSVAGDYSWQVNARATGTSVDYDAYSIFQYALRP